MEEQTKETKGTKFKGKKFWLKVVGVIIVLSMFYSFGSSGAKAELEGEKVTHDELISKIEEKKQEIKEVESDLEDINKQYEEKNDEFTEALNVLRNKESMENKIDYLVDKMNTMNSEIESLDKQIAEKQKLLKTLNGKVLEAKGKPITLPAGKFIVGEDIPADRYSVTPNSRGGNFFVNGGATVNVMLGKGDMYEDEYVFRAKDGDEIELTLSANFTPVE